MMEEEKWKKCPFTIWDRNPSFPPLSDALGITFSETGGRHVIAKRNIIAGKYFFLHSMEKKSTKVDFSLISCKKAPFYTRNGHF